MPSIIERIEAAVEAALAADPDDWAGAGSAAETASGGRYTESAAMVDRFAGDGKTVSAGLLDREPVRLTIDPDGAVWLVGVELPELDPAGQWEVRYVDPDGDVDGECYDDLTAAELVAAVRHAQGYGRVEVVDLASLVPVTSWDQDALTHRDA